MGSKSNPPEIEDAGRQYELAPLTALALLIADWVKVHGVKSLAKRPTVEIVGSSDDAHSSR